MSLNSSPPHARSSQLTGMLLLIFSTLLFGIMDGMGKLLARDCPVTQIVWARYFFAAPVVLFTSVPRTWLHLFRCERPSLQAARGVLPVFINCVVVTGLSLMPLADATAIGFMSPLLVVALSAPLLNEKVSFASWAGVALGFAGVVVVARPGSGLVGQAALFPLAGAVGFAFYQILTRVVGQRDAPRVTLAWTIGTGLLVLTPALFYAWRPVPAQAWFMLILSGVLFGFGQLLFIHAYRFTSATLLAPLTYAQIIAAVLFGFVVFGDVPDGWTIAGTTLIIVSGVYVLRQRAST